MTTPRRITAEEFKQVLESNEGDDDGPVAHAVGTYSPPT
jgi:hypothetical protein